MLLFIREAFKDQTTVLLFQYISCYSLSKVDMKKAMKRASFNTSHVTLYLRKMRIWCSHADVSIHLMLLFIYVLEALHLGSQVSIHLMLLFIDKEKEIGYIVKMFQYISCYSLSTHTITIGGSGTCFNTSHVTLYRYAGHGHVTAAEFQYISCYSLSSKSRKDLADRYLFQYISCYSLSR